MRVNLISLGACCGMPQSVESGESTPMHRGDSRRRTRAFRLGATWIALAALVFLSPAVSAASSGDECSLFPAATPTYPVGGGPQSVVTADFNGDHIVDIAVANVVTNDVSILLGNGDGTVQAAASYAFGFSAFYQPTLVTGDFNSDGHADLAVAADGSVVGPPVSVLLGNGDGTFQTAHLYGPPLGASSNWARSIVVADFDGDGNVDLAVADLTWAPADVILLPGDGHGAFGTGINIGTVDQAISLAVGDFNGDSKPDLAVVSLFTGEASVLLNTGTGLNSFQFTPRGGYPVGSSPVSLAVGDFNGDHRDDLAVADYDSGDVSILLGDGLGTFSATASYESGTLAPLFVTTGDFNADGRLDLVVVGDRLSVLLGDAGGTFQAPVPYSSGGTPGGASVGDFNLDGKADLAVSDLNANSVAVLLGNGDGTFPTDVSYPTGRQPFGLAAGDLNADGKLDVVTTNQGSGDVSVLMGHGDGTLGAATAYAVGGLSISVAMGDFNNDGKVDLADATRPVSVLLGNGDGTFQTAHQYGADVRADSIAVADFNGDGKADLAVGVDDRFHASLGGDVEVLLGNGDGTFQPPLMNGMSGSLTYFLTVGDFNGDGMKDLAVSHNNAATVSILLGQGDGSFGAPIDYSFPDLQIFSLAVGDFNGDHKADLAIAFANHGVLVALGNGDGTLSAPVQYDVGHLIVSVTVGDFNADGRSDLAAADGSTDSVWVLFGNGDGTFQAAVNYGKEIGPAAVVAADFDGDHRPDLAVTNRTGNSVTVLLSKFCNAPPVARCADVTVGAECSATASVDGGSYDPDAGDTFTLAQSPAGPYALGTTAVTLTVTDSRGLSSQCQGTVTVLLSKSCNAAPVARCANVTVGAGATCSATASVDGGSYDPDAGDTMTFAQSPAGPYALGTTAVTLTVTDTHGLSSQCQGSVTVVDQTPPAIVCPGPISVIAGPGVCGATVAFAATVGDNCSVGVAYDIGGTPVSSPRSFPIGTTTVHALAMDGAGNSASCTFNVSVANQNPMVTLTGPPSGSLYPVNTSVAFSGRFTDIGGGTHAGTWTFDTLSAPATIVEPSGATPGSATVTRAFSAAGVYQVKLTINDSCGGSGTADQINGMSLLVVIYDPSAGFVTGGGWINSPPGAYAADPSLTGRANFGFVSKYQKGTSVPIGETEFEFQVANFDFHSSSYQWLVISGAMAQYKGTGTINGGGPYNFLLTAYDGDLSAGGGVDKFRIKITDMSGAVVYDNGYGGADDIKSANPQPIGGGSIVIHK